MFSAIVESTTQITADGKYSAWWETYLRNKGFQIYYCRFDGLSALWQYRSKAVGIIGMDIPHLEMGHLVSVDQIGVIDPATAAPGHVALQEYVHTRVLDGVRFHDEWLAVWVP